MTSVVWAQKIRDIREFVCYLEYVGGVVIRISRIIRNVNLSINTSRQLYVYVEFSQQLRTDFDPIARMLIIYYSKMKARCNPGSKSVRKFHLNDSKKDYFVYSTILVVKFVTSSRINLNLNTCNYCSMHRYTWHTCSLWTKTFKQMIIISELESK